MDPGGTLVDHDATAPPHAHAGWPARRSSDECEVDLVVFGTFCAEAVSDCNLIAYRRRGVEAAALHDETLARQLLSHAMQSVSHAQKHAFLLGRRAATEKVASFLLDWAARHGRKDHADLPMSRQDMADYLGLTIETVSRTLSQLERDGVIAIANARQIVFRNREALEDLVG